LPFIKPDEDPVRYCERQPVIHKYIHVIDNVCQDLLGQDIVGANHNEHRRQSAGTDPVQSVERSVAHSNEQEADDKGKPVRQLVGEVHPVPDEVQFIDIQTEEHEDEERPVQQFLSVGDLPGHEVAYQHHGHQISAAEIRQPVQMGQMRRRKQLVEHIQHIVIEAPLLRHLRREVVRILHADVRWQKHHSGHADPDQGRRDCAQRGEEARLRASVSDCDEIVHWIVKQYEDAHHDGDVVVAEDNDRQRHRIQRHASVFDKAVQS